MTMTPPAVMAVPIAVVAITGVNSDAVTVMTVAMRRGRAPFHNDVKADAEHRSIFSVGAKWRVFRGYENGTAHRYGSLGSLLFPV